jgi:drug/metabolite transporter (DMT)-like permease
VATFTWAIGSILTKRKNYDTSPFLGAGMQMFFGGLFCLPFSFVFDDLSHIVWSPEVVYGLTYLIVFGSVMAFTMYAYTLNHLPITIASLYSYINPLVAVVLGWLVLSEKLNMKIGVAFIITVTGIYLVNYGYQQQRKKKYKEVVV